MKELELFNTERYLQAFQSALNLHKLQTRKGSGTPYIAHLMSVSALVLENGGDTDQACAALLHDSVEDQGGEETLTLIKSIFGDRVAAIVMDLSDSTTIPKPPWKERKEAYLTHLMSVDRDVLLVSIADKLHNVRSIIHDHKRVGENIWSRFTGKKLGTIWYYQSLSKIYLTRFPGPLSEDFSDLVDILSSL